MKHVVLVPDGAADYPLEALGRRTPLEVAHTPNMDRLAREGWGGTVQIIPPSRPPGSDVGNLELFGYDSEAHDSGRAPLEAASLGVELEPEDVAYRCNLITRDGDTLVDYSAGHIGTDEGRALVGELAAALSGDGRRFYPGVAYRHLLVWRQGPAALTTVPPHDIMGQSIEAHLPRGEGERQVREVMAAAEPLLARSAVNQRRVAAGQRPANAIWLWGSGRALRLASLERRYGLRCGVIAAVDLVRGIGRYAGCEVIEVPGITGYLDTNYAGKATYALEALARLDLVYVHVEAPDEASHNGDAAAKQRALEDFDRLVAGPVMTGLEGMGGGRILLAPDHRTPIRLRTHSREPVPFAVWGPGVAANGMAAFNEPAGDATGLRIARGRELMDYLVGRKVMY